MSQFAGKHAEVDDTDGFETLHARCHGSLMISGKQAETESQGSLIPNRSAIEDVRVHPFFLRLKS